MKFDIQKAREIRAALDDIRGHTVQISHPEILQAVNMFPAALDRIEELESIITAPVESFGTGELIEWSNQLQMLLDVPESERGNISFVLGVGSHLEKFAKSWHSPTMIKLKNALIEERAKCLYFAHAGDGMYDMDVLEEADHLKTRHLVESEEQLQSEGRL